MSMTPEETQRRVAALEARIQELDKKLSEVRPSSIQKASQGSSQVVLGALPATLKSILNLGFDWIANRVNIKAGLGIAVDSTGVRAKIKSGGGLSVDASGLYSGVNPAIMLPTPWLRRQMIFLLLPGRGNLLRRHWQRRKLFWGSLLVPVMSLALHLPLTAILQLSIRPLGNY